MYAATCVQKGVEALTAGLDARFIQEGEDFAAKLGQAWSVSNESSHKQGFEEGWVAGY